MNPTLAKQRKEKKKKKNKGQTLQLAAPPDHFLPDRPTDWPTWQARLQDLYSIWLTTEGQEVTHAKDSLTSNNFCLLHLTLRWEKRWAETHTAHGLLVRKCNYCLQALEFSEKGGQHEFWKSARVHGKMWLKQGFETRHTFPLPWKMLSFTLRWCDKRSQKDFRKGL